MYTESREPAYSKKKAASHNKTMCCDWELILDDGKGRDLIVIVAGALQETF